MCQLVVDRPNSFWCLHHKLYDAVQVISEHEVASFCERGVLEFLHVLCCLYLTFSGGPRLNTAVMTVSNPEYNNRLVIDRDVKKTACNACLCLYFARSF